MRLKEAKMNSKNKKTVKEIIFERLVSLSKNGEIKLHTKDVHRRLIPSGLGSCSADRYLRWLRAEGKIEYDDPGRNNYIYLIKIK